MPSIDDGEPSHLAAVTEPGPVQARADVASEASRLLTLVAGGDQRAFSDLYDLLTPSVYGVCLRVLRDPSHAEEVAQEVLVEVWKTACRFDPERGNARSFALVIAHRRSVDRVRGEEAHRRRNTEQHHHNAEPEVSDSVAESVIDDFEATQARRALDVLSKLQREAIELAYYQGKTYAEVALALGVPLGTIKTRIRDGLSRMRSELGSTTTLGTSS